MSKGLDICKVFVSDVALSDHYCISFEMSVTDVIHTRSDVTLRRYINENTCPSFIQAFLAAPALTPNPVSNLVDTFNAKLTNFIAAIAPVKVKKTFGKEKAPWRNSPSVKLQKTECRKAERRWRKTKLKIHHDIYKEELFTYGLELKKARQSFFSDLINTNMNNSRLLFSAIDRLTNPRMEIAPELISTQKCNEFEMRKDLKDQARYKFLNSES